MVETHSPNPRRLERPARRIFISHTSELRSYPADRSFVAAAEAAISRAGDAIVEMAYFTAGNHGPPDKCRHAISTADIYVGIIGFQYGSAVGNDAGQSYAEFEFDFATERELPRLVFLLDETATLPLPAGAIIDLAHGSQQWAFRKRLEETAGTTIATVGSPAQLETLLYQALTESKSTDDTEAARRLRQMRVGDENLDRAVQALAGAVRRQWRDEAAMRGLHRPRPLRVSWSTTRKAAAHPAAVLDDPELHGYVARMALHGDISEVVSDFRRLPRPQMMVLGEPGAGKTVLAILLTLGLLDQAGADEPVPLLLSLSSWRPRLEHLDAWMARRMAEDYPFLSRSTALALVTSQRVLPVLDGLDELPAELHAVALDELDRATGGGAPLVVTCRSSAVSIQVGQGACRQRAGSIGCGGGRQRYARRGR
jgi:hypothetical protein